MKMRRILSFCAVLLLAFSFTNASSVCYGYLGCFSMAAPWYSLTRPVPAPQSPDVIATGFYLYTRAQPARYYVTKLPDITLTGSDFSGVKPTFFITHGFVQDGNDTWLDDMKDALLEKYDCNVILVDWGRGSSTANYFLVASNIRVVAAEVVRLAKFLVEEEGADVTNWHMIGHSLGSHVFSYVGKTMPGVGRITALDPAQPGFEGYSKDVRLDASDAEFVDVIHTNARPFIPLGGLGMVGAVGHVDFYMNGGLDQPGCIVPPPRLFSFSDLYRGQLQDLMSYVGCPHQRSYLYFTASVRDSNCTFWGRRLQDIVMNRPCGSDNCSPMGLEAEDYPATGSFQVITNSLDPYCTLYAEADSSMAKFRRKSLLRPKRLNEFRSLRVLAPQFYSFISCLHLQGTEGNKSCMFSTNT